MDIEPQKILISTQGPVKEPYKTEIKNLFKSINLLGGNLKKAQKVVVFSEPVDSLFAEELVRNGARIRIDEDIDTRCVHANKIQILNIDIDDYDDFDILIVLDTDVIICNDFTSIIKNDLFQAKPVDQDPLTIEQWKNLFRFFGLELSKERYLTNFHRTETIPYFNSGVLIIPRQYVSKLYVSWKEFVIKLLESYPELGNIGNHSFFTDQFALSLALCKNQIPFDELPLKMNFPTHNEIHPSFKPESESPSILHYHHKLENNEKISHCTYENINQIIDYANNVLDSDKSELAITSFFDSKFDNRSFWNERYKNNIQLGSGIGSRGKYIDLKRNIIQKIVSSFLPSSVLDVGCGDIEIVKALEFPEYLGTVLGKVTTQHPPNNILI